MITEHRRPICTALVCLCVVLLASCDGSSSGSSDGLHTSLNLDLSAQSGSAVLSFNTAEREESLELGDLAVESISLDGKSVSPDTLVDGPRGAVLVKPAGVKEVKVQYHFASHDSFDGYSTTSGLSFLWPYFCGNLFPCLSSPEHGNRFEMSISGVPQGMTAIYPSRIDFDAPSYMPALAVGNFIEMNLGTTRAGTQVKSWILPGMEEAAKTGTALLRDGFDFYEQTYGSYPFGSVTGSVAAQWGGDAYGGMEHHPFWHVATNAFDSTFTHLHEAAHGWYGNGVRIACWEDFVLSEGTAEYFAAHYKATLDQEYWKSYICGYVRQVCDPVNAMNTIALPDETCNQIDIYSHPIWSAAPYAKGAMFYHAVGQLIGDESLDNVLQSFFQDHRGGTARMQDMLEAILKDRSAEIQAKIREHFDAWLKKTECPIDFAAFCA